MIAWRAEIENGSRLGRPCYQTVVYGRQCSNEAREYSCIVRNILIASNTIILEARIMGMCMMNNRYG